jgi:hypothetical protein
VARDDHGWRSGPQSIPSRHKEFGVFVQGQSHFVHPLTRSATTTLVTSLSLLIASCSPPPSQTAAAATRPVSREEVVSAAGSKGNMDSFLSLLEDAEQALDQGNEAEFTRLQVEGFNCVGASPRAAVVDQDSSIAQAARRADVIICRYLADLPAQRAAMKHKREAIPMPPPELSPAVASFFHARMFLDREGSSFSADLRTALLRDGQCSGSSRSDQRHSGYVGDDPPTLRCMNPCDDPQGMEQAARVLRLHIDSACQRQDGASVIPELGLLLLQIDPDANTASPLFDSASARLPNHVETVALLRAEMLRRARGVVACDASYLRNISGQLNVLSYKLGGPQGDSRPAAAVQQGWSAYVRAHFIADGAGAIECANEVRGHAGSSLLADLLEFDLRSDVKNHALRAREQIDYERLIQGDGDPRQFIALYGNKGEHAQAVGELWRTALIDEGRNVLSQGDLEALADYASKAKAFRENFSETNELARTVRAVNVRSKEVAKRERAAREASRSKAAARAAGRQDEQALARARRRLSNDPGLAADARGFAGCMGACLETGQDLSDCGLACNHARSPAARCLVTCAVEGLDDDTCTLRCAP